MAKDTGDHSTDRTSFHQPVMLPETIHHLSVKPGGVYLDATAGEGGHSSAILEASSPTGKVLGIDLDPRSIEFTAQRLAHYESRFIPISGNYGDMLDLSQSKGVTRFDGVLMDLGFSSRQVEAPGYGLSFLRDEPLDMRYDPQAQLTAAHIVNTYSEEDLADLIYQFGEEPRSRSIARRILAGRPIEMSAHLARVVAGAFGPRRGRKIHPATRTFQALRIGVNDELGNLERGLAAALRLLQPSGRLVVISYHSLEDRMVKQFMARESAGCICPPAVMVCVCGHEPTLKRVQKRIIRPSEQEVRQNPRSRSAKMRVAELV